MSAAPSVGTVVARAIAAVALLVAAGGCGDDGVVVEPHPLDVRASGCGRADELARGVRVRSDLVLTVAHALRGARGVSVDGVSGTVVALDHRIDAALIAVAAAGPVAGAGEPATGPATIAGRPGRIARLVTADVEEPRDATTYRRSALLLTAAVARGDSGSAVLAPDGRLVGMVFATSTARAGVAYAVSATELVPFIAAGGTGPVDTGRC